VDEEEFDGCNSECRRKGKHSLRYGSCEFGERPKPTLGYWYTFIAEDGEVSGAEIDMPLSLFCPWVEDWPVDDQWKFIDKLAKSSPADRKRILEQEKSAWIS
jgi:hypothetical protein